MDIEKRWSKNESYCIESQNKDGSLHYKGSYRLDGVVFRFTANEQTKGKQLLRGQVSVFSQRKGCLMRANRKGKGEKPEVVSKSIYPSPPFGTDRSSWRGWVMASVEKAAQSLLDEYRHQIKRDSELSVTPESVTPQMALILYGDAFLRERHANASEKSCEDYLRALRRFFRVLPNKPMASFQEREIAKAIREAQPSKQTVKLAKSFWGYCIDAHRCSGRRPFPEDAKPRRSAAARQAEADRLDLLDEEMQKELYHKVLEEPNGANCGVALMLWGGVDAKTACSLLWKDLLFTEKENVILKQSIEDNAGATHDYSRVLSPQGEAVLLKRKKELTKSYGKTRLSKMPIASLASDPERSLKPDDLREYGKTLLKRIGAERKAVGCAHSKSIEISSRIFENTYAHNLIHRCGLREDEGLFLFLCGRSLAGNVTADHYRSFTDPDGIELQRSVLRRMAPEKKIKLGKRIDRSDPAFDSYYFAASTTQELLSLDITVEGLAPDELVSIISRYGGDIRIEAED